MRSAQLVLASLLFVACGEAAGPGARITRFTGCVVPSGAARMHENIGGDAEQHVTHVKIVMPKDKLDRFLETCGFHRNGLQRGFDHRELAPNQPLFWWDPPDRQLVYGDSREDEGFAIAVVVLERDTDFSVYVHATGSLP